jgi:hypothetical protein
MKHLDLAINVYDREAKTRRWKSRIFEGKATAATFRTHVLGIEEASLPTDIVYLWPVLLLFLRFSTIFKDAASKTGQNQGCHQEEKQAGRSAPRRRASSDTTGPFCS